MWIYSQIYKVKIILVLCFIPFVSKAQFFNDVQSRTGVSLEYHLNKKLRFEGRYYLYLNKDITSYQRSAFFVRTKYKLKQWLTTGFEYRYGLKKDANFHELRFFFTFTPDLNFGKWGINFTPLVQQRHESHPSPVFYLRNLAEVRYNVSDRFYVFVLTENYLDISNKFSFDTQDTKIGSATKVGKSGSLTSQVSMKNKRENMNFLRFELTYKFILGR